MEILGHYRFGFTNSVRIICVMLNQFTKTLYNTLFSLVTCIASQKEHNSLSLIFTVLIKNFCQNNAFNKKVLMRIPVNILLDMQFHHDIKAAAAFFGVSTSTVYRWISKEQLPPWALNMLRARDSKSMRVHGRRWDEWRVDEDGLTTPDGKRITIEQLRAYSCWIDSNHTVTPQAANYMRLQMKKASL